MKEIFKQVYIFSNCSAVWGTYSQSSKMIFLVMWVLTTTFDSVCSLDFRLIWEETLLDSLLNFAVTPKGLLLLQQTGAINECVAYMFSRFTKKLQVILCFNAMQVSLWLFEIGHIPSRNKKSVQNLIVCIISFICLYPIFQVCCSQMQPNLQPLLTDS